MIISKRIQFITLVSCFFTLLTAFCQAEAAKDFDEKRNKLIGYMLYKQLPSIHFSDKKVDDSLALAAFDLYLKQLDYQKRFLLIEDTVELKKYALKIDDNMKSGNIILPEIGFQLLTKRVAEAEKIVNELMANGFDTSLAEQYETDPDKLGYVKNVKELRQRWRKILKAQVVSRYLDLKEKQETKKEKKDKEEPGKESDQDAREENPENENKTVDDATLWQQANDKVVLRNGEFFTRLNQETLQDHYDRFFNSFTRAFDPHTNYMAPAKKEDFDIHMRGSLEGIGALLREDDGYIKVVRIIPGSASARQGLLGAEDIILEVAQGPKEPVEVTDMRLREAVRLIRGAKGTEVRLTVKKPDGSILVIPIIRDVVQIEETFVKSTVLESVDGGKVGYIMIPSFYRDFEMTRNGGVAKNSTDDTRVALQELKKQDIRGLILDLRDNGGGSLVDAVDITGLFIKSGPVVQVKNSFGTRKVLVDEDEDIVYDGPLVVLVNLFSASASEILAAALQDYGRAVIVGGKHTHGKGSVQTVLDMNENIPLLHLQRYDDLGALKVTIQKFYRINGGSTQYRGVEPDIVLPSLFGHLKSGEQYIDYSLPWDQVEPVEYSPYSKDGLKLDDIRKNSMDRVGKDEGMAIIAEEAQKSMARIEETSVSLKLEDMEKKRKESNATRKKVGAHYKKYQEEQLDQYESTEDKDSDNSNKKSDKDIEEQEWLEELKKDPYVSEAVKIFADLAP